MSPRRRKFVEFRVNKDVYLAKDNLVRAGEVVEADQESERTRGLVLVYQRGARYPQRVHTATFAAWLAAGLLSQPGFVQR